MNSDGDNMHRIACVAAILGQSEVRRTFDKALRAPVAGIPTVASPYEKLQADLLFLDDIISVRVMAVFPKYPLLVPSRTKNPREVWDAPCGSWIGVSGPPMCIQMDEGAEWNGTVFGAKLCSGRRIRLHFRGVGARPWILERLNCAARGIYYRLRGDDRFSGKQTLAGA